MPLRVTPPPSLAGVASPNSALVGGLAPPPIPTPEGWLAVRHPGPGTDRVGRGMVFPLGALPPPLDLQLALAGSTLWSAFLGPAVGPRATDLYMAAIQWALGIDLATPSRATALSEDCGFPGRSEVSAVLGVSPARQHASGYGKMAHAKSRRGRGRPGIYALGCFPSNPAKVGLYKAWADLEPIIKGHDAIHLKFCAKQPFWAKVWILCGVVQAIETWNERRVVLNRIPIPREIRERYLRLLPMGFDATFAAFGGQEQADLPRLLPDLWAAVEAAFVDESPPSMAGSQLSPFPLSADEGAPLGDESMDQDQESNVASAPAPKKKAEVPLTHAQSLRLAHADRLQARITASVDGLRDPTDLGDPSNDDLVRFSPPAKDPSSRPPFPLATPVAGVLDYGPSSALGLWPPSGSEVLTLTSPSSCRQTTLHRSGRLSDPNLHATTRARWMRLYSLMLSGGFPVGLSNPSVDPERSLTCAQRREAQAEWVGSKDPSVHAAPILCPGSGVNLLEVDETAVYTSCGALISAQFLVNLLAKGVDIDATCHELTQQGFLTFGDQPHWNAYTAEGLEPTCPAPLIREALVALKTPLPMASVAQDTTDPGPLYLILLVGSHPVAPVHQAEKALKEFLPQLAGSQPRFVIPCTVGYLLGFTSQEAQRSLLVAGSLNPGLTLDRLHFFRVHVPSAKTYQMLGLPIPGDDLASLRDDLLAVSACEVSAPFIRPPSKDLLDERKRKLALQDKKHEIHGLSIGLWKTPFATCATLAAKTIEALPSGSRPPTFCDHFALDSVPLAVTSREATLAQANALLSNLQKQGLGGRESNKEESMPLDVLERLMSFAAASQDSQSGTSQQPPKSPNHKRSLPGQGGPSGGKNPRGGSQFRWVASPVFLSLLGLLLFTTLNKRVEPTPFSGGGARPGSHQSFLIFSRYAPSVDTQAEVNSPLTAKTGGATDARDSCPGFPTFLGGRALAPGACKATGEGLPFQPLGHLVVLASSRPPPQLEQSAAAAITGPEPSSACVMDQGTLPMGQFTLLPWADSWSLEVKGLCPLCLGSSSSFLDSLSVAPADIPLIVGVLQARGANLWPLMVWMGVLLSLWLRLGSGKSRFISGPYSPRSLLPPLLLPRPPYQAGELGPLCPRRVPGASSGAEQRPSRGRVPSLRHSGSQVPTGSGPPPPPGGDGPPEGHLSQGGIGPNDPSSTLGGGTPHKSRGAARLLLANVDGLNDHNYSAITAFLEEAGADLGAITETKLWAHSPCWFATVDPVWELHRVDFHPVDQHSRGGVALLVRRGQTSVDLVTSQHGPLTWAMWRVKTPAWSHDLLVAVVYRSPSVAGDELNRQWLDLTALLLHLREKSEGLAPTARQVLPVVMGDFNAHTGIAVEGPHVLHLPVRRADSAPHHQPHSPPHARTGAAFLDMLAGTGFMIVNNRLSSIPGLYSRQCLRGERVENSIIDYILVRPRDWSHVLAEGVWEDSGPLFASDHNMLFVDLNLAGLLPPPPLPEGGGFFPPVSRGLFRVRSLRANSYSSPGHSDSPGILSLPRTDYERLLLIGSRNFSHTFLQCSSVRHHGGLLAGKRRAISDIHHALVNCFAVALEGSVGRGSNPNPPGGAVNRPTSKASRFSTPLRKPPTPVVPAPLQDTFIQAREKVRAARLHLQWARHNQPSDIPDRQGQFNLAASLLLRVRRQAVRLSQEMSFRQFEGLSTLSPSHWDDLRNFLPGNLGPQGLPRAVRTEEGRLLHGQQAALYWHKIRENISRDQSGEARFATASLQALRHEDHLLSSNQAFHDHLAQLLPQAPAGDMAAPLTFEEVDFAVRSCRVGSKAPGPDLIPYEAFTYGGSTAKLILFQFFTLCWEWELHPHEWDAALVQPLFKKGDHQDPRNYRAVTLTSCICKVWEAVLLARLGSILGPANALAPSQGGFRAHTSTTEMVVALHSHLSARLASGSPTFICFVDFQTAFPSIFKPLVWVRLFGAGVTGRLWRVLRSLYQNVKSTVLHPLIPLSSFFPIPQGLREGSKVSPILFNVAVNDMYDFFRLLVWEGSPVGSDGPGASMGGTWQLADDTALTAKSAPELQFMIFMMQDFCRHRGLTLNLAKCAVLEVGCPHLPVVPRNEYIMQDPTSGAVVPLDLVEEYKYLGTFFDSRLTMAKNLQATIQKFWAAHHKAQSLGMRPGALSPLLRSHLWKTMLLPHITFALPYMSKKQMQKMQTAMNLSLRLTFQFHSSPHLLLRETGILPLEALHLQVLACLFGTLETSHPHLNSFKAHRQFLGGSNKGIPVYERFAFALRALGLDSHVHQMQLHLLPAPLPRAASLPPQPWAGPLLTFRAPWKSLVKRLVRNFAELEFQRWSSYPDTAPRASLYAADVALSRRKWGWGRPAPYLLWGLPSSVASKLLLLRSQATQLAAHASAWDLQLSGLDAQEGFCPLCLGVPPHSQHQDSLFHLCIECPFLEGPRVQLGRVIAGLVSPPHQQSSASLSEAWSRLPPHARHHLLLGNYVPCALMKLLPGSSKGQKMRHFLMATTPLLFQMLLFRYNLSDVLYPVI